MPAPSTAMTISRGIALAASLAALGCSVGSAAGQSGSSAAVAIAAGAFALEPVPASPPPPGATVAAQPFDYFTGLSFMTGPPSPQAFLGYPLGERFTQHHQVVGYVKALAETSSRATYQQYGKTHQGRALSLLTISSPENLANLDDILARNLELTTPGRTSPARAREIIETNPAIIWLSYNVHGNEASSSEAALRVAYTMAAATNDEVESILDNVVLFLDPMINPDGRERYVSWHRNAAGVSANANPDAAEHDEPWPGGRTNHYLFDLNRDWLWMVHPESQARIAAYKRVMPQLHVDYHEQGYRSPYFFGAGDDPYNANIPAATREWINRYGEANARVFDAHGLVYATRERFDYLYPGYGKVLPVYHGAVGLLCEQAGHGFAGRAVQVEGDYTLTLRERARHHFLTSMSYLETTAANRQGQLERFAGFFRDSLELAAADDKAYVISAASDPALLDKVWRLCAGHGVAIERTTAQVTASGMRSYATGEALEPTTIPAGSWVIRADQPMGRLARAIFERSTHVSHEETYDITGWSVPIAFGLDAWFTKASLDAPTQALTEFAAPAGALEGQGDYAILVDAAQHHFPVVVGLAVKHGVFSRRTGDDIEIAGRNFAKGSLIVHQVRNKPEALRAFVRDVRAAGLTAVRVDSGMTSSGPVLGTNENGLLDLPRVLLVRGEGTSEYSFGQHWHLLDVESPMPYTAVNADALGRIDLDEYNVIVLPAASGSLSRILGEQGVDRITQWVRAGGALVASGSGAFWASREMLKLDNDGNNDDGNGNGNDGDDGDDDGNDEPALSALSWKQREDRRLEENVPGALLRVEIDTTHPLASGVREWVGVLKFSRRALPVADDGFVVGRIAAESPRISGVLSERVRERLAGSPFMTHHRLGRGNVICFADDQTFRGFLHAPMRLLLNAIVFGPSL